MYYQNYKTAILAVCCLFISFSKSNAQEIDIRNTEWMSYLEELSESEESENSQIEVLFEELSYLSEHPFNLNSAEKKDLEQLPFLNEIQIENLLYYVYKYGPLVDIYELKNVPELDRQSLIYLLPFVYVGEVQKESDFRWKDVFTKSKQEILLRSDYTFQEKAGYKSATEEEKAESPNKFYLGEPYYLSLRYGLRFRDFVQLGIAAEKDAGEAFWNKHHKGFDYYAFNLNIKDIGILKSLHIGDYRLTFGEGLVMNTGFSMTQTSNVSNIEQKNSGIKRHVSTAEAEYFRGIAGNIRLKNIETVIFYSYRNHDANADSLNIYSFKTDGYHRIPNDLNKRNTAQVNTVGSNIRWRNDHWVAGASFVYYNFGNKQLNPDLQTYNLFYLREKEFWNTGIHYKYSDKHFSFSGETALDGHGKWASINHLIMSPSSTVNLAVSYRNYGKDYNAFYGKAFGESTSVQNEKGMYFGLQFRPFSRWELSASFDHFSFPWLKYNVNSPTRGNSALVNIQYNLSDFRFLFRYKYKEKQKNNISEDGRQTSVLPYEQHRFRLQANYPAINQLSFRTQIDYTLYKENTPESGWAVSQQFSFSSSKIKINGAATYFRTDNWNTRISIYENNVLYAFSFPNYYGNGLRTYFTINYKTTKNLTLYIKLANTHYFDRIVIGSGLEEIEGYNKTDISALFRFAF